MTKPPKGAKKEKAKPPYEHQPIVDVLERILAAIMARQVGDSLPPLPPPAPCDLEALCAMQTTIAEAPGGSFLTIEDGVITILVPPNPIPANLIPILGTNGQWLFGTAPAP